MYFAAFGDCTKMRQGVKLVITQEHLDKLKEAADLLVPFTIMAKILGTTDRTLLTYRTKGEVDYKAGKDTIASRLYKVISDGEVNFVINNLTSIDKAGQEGKWQANAWLLERRRPQDYGKVIKIESADEEDEEIDLSKLTKAQQKSLRKVLIKDNSSDE